MREVVVQAPASSANLGSGFDVFAIALDKPVDRLRITAKDSTKFELKIYTNVSGIPTEPNKNVVGVVASEIADEFGIKAKVSIIIEKKVPVGLGLGSSGASSAACSVGINHLFNLGLSKEDLIYFAGKGEEASTGSIHYDNVSASLAGGFIIVKGENKPSILRIDPPQYLYLCIASPMLKLPKEKTKYARKLLPKNVKLSSLIYNVSRASLLATGFAIGNIDLIGEGMDDSVVEPVRCRLIPAYSSVRSSAIKAGASGVCISGAGPSMLAVVDIRKKEPEIVLGAMINAFVNAGVRAKGFVTRPGEGARIIESC